MPTKRIADLPQEPCRDPKHLPPSMRFFRDGVYEHVCESCGARMVFAVANPRLEAPRAEG